MKKTAFTSVFAFTMWCGIACYGAEPRFNKVSDHCYYLGLERSGENVAAVATDDGVLIINPPPEPELSVATGALKRITSKAVRWMIFTDQSIARSGGTRLLSEQGAQLLTSFRLRALSKQIVVKTDTADGTAPKSIAGDSSQNGSGAFPELVFDHQMHLFPSNLEIRIFEVRSKARTGGDVIVFVPAEKVLIVGDFFETGSFPDIDVAADGSAVGWIEGMKQVIDAVPLLRSAIPLTKPLPKSEPEKTLEEKVVVVTGRGDAANLQDMKDLLELSQKLRNDISKSIKMGRSWDSFVASPVSEPYRGYPNFAQFAARLFENLTAAGK